MRLELVCFYCCCCYCCWLTLAFALASSESEPLHLTQQLPPSIVASEFSSLTLSCGFEPPPDYITWSFAQAGQPLSILIRCQPNKGTCGDVNSNMTGFVNSSITPNGTLTVPNLGKGHSGRYNCQGLLKLQLIITETSVSVLVAPTLPSVSTNSSQPSAGSSLLISCSTSGGNPPPKLSWQIRAATSASGFEPPTATDLYKETSIGSTDTGLVPFGTVTSYFIISKLKPENNRAFVRCLATNPVANLTSPEYVLDVRYEPIMKPMSALAMELGSETVIECSATGNPDPAVRLENSIGEILSAVSHLTVSYRLTAHQPSQSGTYRCIGSNQLGSSNASFNIDIQYGPRVSGPGSVTVRTGDMLTIECSADANPPATTAGIVWRHVTSGRTVSGAGAKLVIDRADRSDAGVWQCRYTNVVTPTGGSPVQRQGSADTTVIVEYPPGLPVTSATAKQLVRGDNLTVACSANADSPGVPSPSFRWTKSGSLFQSQGPTLSLPNVSLPDSGVYFCTPSNAAGQGPMISVNVDVEQPPEWLDAQPRQPVTTSVSAVKEFRLACTARAKPEVSFAWYKDGRLILADWFSVETASTADGDVLGGIRTTSYLNFRGSQRVNGQLRPEDNGLYLCEASNKRGKISAEIPLIVEFEPQIVPVETKIAKPDASSVDFSCPVLAQPRPSVSWQFERPSGDSVSFDSSASFETVYGIPYQYLSRLERVTALGLYTCIATNRLGSSRVTFRVLSPTIPDAPTQLRVLSAGWEFVAVSWSTAFSGGSPVQYWSRLQTRDSATGQVRIANRRCDTSTRTNITGLMPGTNYTIQIYGLNELGQSNYSAPVSQVTASLSLPKPIRVQLNEDGTKLTVTLAAAQGYCLRIEVSEDAGSSWSLYQYCLPIGNATPIIVTGINRNLLYRVSACLAEREEVCGLSTLSTASMTTLPEVQTSTIVIVGASCTAVIIVLITVLTYFCCKRPKVYKDMESLNATNNRLQPSPPSSQCQYGQVPDGVGGESVIGKPYALIPPHQSFSVDDIAAVEAAAAVAAVTTANQLGVAVGGVNKPLLTARSSHASSGIDTSSNRISSTFVQSKSMESALAASAAAGQGGQKQFQQQQQQLPTTFGYGDRRRSGGTVVFATLGSGHNPLDSSVSNPAIFCYPAQQQQEKHQHSNFSDDNRNTDPYSFDGSCSMRQKKIVYEVVV